MEVQIEFLRKDPLFGFVWATLRDGQRPEVNTHWADEVGCVWTVMCLTESEALLRSEDRKEFPKGASLWKCQAKSGWVPHVVSP